jgi:hypothetical protein
MTGVDLNPEIACILCKSHTDSRECEEDMVQ